MPVLVKKSGITVGVDLGDRTLFGKTIRNLEKHVYSAGEYLREPVDPSVLKDLEDGDPQTCEYLAIVDYPQPVEPSEVVEYDPADYSVEEVLAYLEEADDDERVISAERKGKNRKGITGE